MKTLIEKTFHRYLYDTEGSSNNNNSNNNNNFINNNNNSKALFQSILIKMYI